MAGARQRDKQPGPGLAITRVDSPSVLLPLSTAAHQQQHLRFKNGATCRFRFPPEELLASADDAILMDQRIRQPVTSDEQGCDSIAFVADNPLRRSAVDYVFAYLEKGDKAAAVSAPATQHSMS